MIFAKKFQVIAVGYVDQKSRFPAGDKIGLPYTVEKDPFDPNCFDRAIRYTRPVVKLDF